MRHAARLNVIFGAAMGSLAAASAFAQTVTTFNGVPAVVEKTIPGVGDVLLPESSIARPEDHGLRAHTNYKILRLTKAPGPLAEPKVPGPMLTKPETPASMACVYRVVAQTMGCDPDDVSTVATGGSKAIGIVDAFHNKTALKDLKKFSTQFGLPAPKLRIEYCSATKCTGVTKAPPADQGWAGEIALDIQWAHAMAPKAKIILVEAFSNSYVDLMRAVDRAAELVAAEGGGQVSNSYGGLEFGSQTTFDNHFVHSKVVFFASTGDHHGGTNNIDVNWPSTSPNVIGVGGTTIIRKADGTFDYEQAWLNTGGGLSSIYARPSFQNGVMSEVKNHRGVPDVAWNADPASGVYVYCSAGTCGSSGGFLVFGGTSLASPAIAAMTNNANHFRGSTAAEQTVLYKGLGTGKFTDVIKGKCGNGTNGKFVNAVAGWDRCTGIGTPRTLKGL